MDIQSAQMLSQARECIFTRPKAMAVNLSYSMTIACLAAKAGSPLNPKGDQTRGSSPL